MPGFKKIERLCGKKDIELLYSSGKNKIIQPLKLYWRITSFNGPPARIVISVPKRLFKKAVDRNRIKRQLREAYRLNKETLYTFLEKEKMQCDLLILFIGNVHPEYATLQAAVKKAMEYLSKEAGKI